MDTVSSINWHPVVASVLLFLLLFAFCLSLSLTRFPLTSELAFVAMALLLQWLKACSSVWGNMMQNE